MKKSSGKFFRSLAVLSVLALLCAACPALAAVSVDEASFPDPVFREIVQGFDKNRDGTLSDSEIKAVTSIDCSGKLIRDLTGIGVFTSLKTLNAGSNLLASLDVTGCVRLQELICKNNPLLELNVTGAPKLQHLDCESTYMTELDLSGNPELDDLCVTNMFSLTRLSLAHNPKMKKLWTLGSGLATVNIGSCPELVKVFGTEKSGFGDGYMYADNGWKHVLVINGNATVDASPEVLFVRAESVQDFAGTWELYSMARDGVTYSKSELKNSDGSSLIICIVKGESITVKSADSSAVASVSIDESDGSLKAISYDDSVNYFFLLEDGSMYTESGTGSSKAAFWFSRK